MRELTEGHVHQYIAGKGTRCPFCAGDVFTGMEHDPGVDTDRRYFEVECSDCGSWFIETYSLTDLELVSDGEHGEEV